MATIPLNQTQKDLNEFIKTRHESFKSFTYDDFQKNPYAIELLEHYKEYLKAKETTDTKKVWDFKESINEYMRAHPNINPITFITADSNRIFIVNIKKLFGIEDTLAQKLLHTDYIKITEQQKQNIEEWCLYDKFITRIIKYIKENHPEWKKATKQQKQSLITAYDLLSSEDFSGKNIDLLQFYPEFIEARYGLHQRKTAIAKKLLSYNFPKMTLDIAKKITDQSTKNKNI